jgi:Lrp/AsnC family transcriptional regulator, regulator for asnA, asnC and gidA
MDLDSNDKKILNYLSNHDFESAEDLANNIKVNANTVRRHLRQLKKDGVIRVAALVDPIRMGAPLMVMFGINVKHNLLRQVMLLVSELHEVKWITATTGRYDIVTYTWFRSPAYLSKFIELKLGPIDGIKDSEVLICLPIDGTNTFWLTSKHE